MTGRAVTGLFLACIFVALAAYSVGLLRQDIAAVDLNASAEKITSGDKFNPEFVGGLVGDENLAGILSTCRSSILQAALTVQLHALDRTNVATDYELWSSSVNRAEQLIAHMEQCAPANGDVWLRDAIISRSIAEQPELIRKKAVMAISLSPYEESELLGRISLWYQAGPATVAVASKLIERDLTIFMMQGRKIYVRSTLNVMPERLKPILNQVIPYIPSKRLAEIGL